MTQGIVVNLVPVALDKGTHQEQQRRLRLMEIGDQHLYYLVVIAWGNDNLRTAMQRLQPVTVEPVEKSLNRSLHVAGQFLHSSLSHLAKRRMAPIGSHEVPTPEYLDYEVPSGPYNRDFPRVRTLVVPTAMA